MEEDATRYFIMDLLSSAVVEKLSEAYLDSVKAKIGAAVWDAASETLMAAIPPSITPPPPANPDARPKRAASNKRNADVLYTELKSGMMDPHGLVEPFKYGDPCGVAPHGQQPYRVIVHPQAMVLCDIHCNICSDEVIGILAGRWDAERRIIFIQAAFPCAAQILDDGGATDVELDATAQVIAQDALERMGLRMVGWYHSHPKFLPDPSVIDLANHHSHQAMFKETDSSIEPFVGLIVSTMEKDNPSKLSLQRWFNVHPYEGRLCSSGCGNAVVMPLAVEIDIANVHINLEQSVQVEHPRVKEVLQRETAAAEVQHASIPAPLAANGYTEKKKRPIESEPDGIESVGESSAEGQRKKRSTEPPKPPPIPPPPPPLTAPSSSADSGSRRPIRRTASKLDEAIKDLLSTSTDGKLKAVKPSVSNNRREQPPPTKPSSRQMGKKESKPKHEVVVQSKSPREPVDPLFRSLLVSIGHPGLQSSALARQLIHSCCAELLCLTVNVVSLGFYYSRYARRVDLLSPWQGQLKIHKLRQCTHRWLCHFHCDRPPGSSGMDSYLDLVCRFLQSCWEEFTKSGKLKLKK